MKDIYVATKSRGFLLELYKHLNSFEFHYPEGVYEINTKKNSLVYKLAKSKLGNHLGVIQTPTVTDMYDAAFSFNRLLKSNINYVIYLENPTALFHYCLGRNKTVLGKYRIKKSLSASQLKYIICLSRACQNTLDQFYCTSPNTIVEQIYPLIMPNKYINEDLIKIFTHQDSLKCLYVSSEFELKGGCEILECLKRLENFNIQLTIITDFQTIAPEDMDFIKNSQNITLFEFNLTKEELNEIYASHCILLHPTRQDSFPMTILEAMKSGLAIISTDLYAIPEMVTDAHNGYLFSDIKYRFWNKDNMPNQKVWNNRSKTIYSHYKDNNLTNFLYKKVSILYHDRDLLQQLCLNSYCKSNSNEFSHEYIIQKWNTVLTKTCDRGTAK